MTNKLAGIKPGDRVRVTFEGEVTESGSGEAFSVFIDGANKYQVRSWWGTRSEVNAPTFQIEKLATPLKVGDRVRMENRNGGTVLLVGSERAFIKWDKIRNTEFQPQIETATLITHLEKIT